MRFAPLTNPEGRTFAVEVESVFVSPSTLARVLGTVDGVTAVRVRRRFSSEDPEVHVRFTFLSQPFVVWEPHGDSSHYWIGPDDSVTQPPDIQPLLEALSRHQVSLLRQVVGDLISLRSPAVNHPMIAHRPIMSGIVACAALAACAMTIGWLIKSSAYADRPPIYAIVAFLFALAAGATGLALSVQTVKVLTRPSR